MLKPRIRNQLKRGKRPMNTYLSKAEELAVYHILPEEITCRTDDGKPCPDCGSKAKILKETAEAFKKIREAIGKPIHISSGYRCIEHQRRLYSEAVVRFGSEEKARKHVAKPGGSPHNYGAALDLHPPRGMNPAELYQLIGRLLGTEVRMGLYEWGVHIDRCYLLSPNPDPRNFVRSVRW